MVYDYLEIRKDSKVLTSKNTPSQNIWLTTVVYDYLELEIIKDSEVMTSKNTPSQNIWQTTVVYDYLEMIAFALSLD